MTYKCCKGCLSYIEASCSAFGANPYLKNCPCSYCLVKSVCVDGCKEYLKYTGVLQEEAV